MSMTKMAMRAAFLPIRCSAVHRSILYDKLGVFGPHYPNLGTTGSACIPSEIAVKAADEHSIGFTMP